MRRGSNRRLFLLVLLAGMAAFTAVWYTSQRDVGSGEPDFGGQYVEGMTGTPNRINPLYAGLNAVDQSITALVFAGLTRLDDHGRPFPDLAETWTASDDGLVFTFTLRPGLVWQDGAPVTAEDVTFTYQLLQSAEARPSTMTPKPLLEATISAVDGRIVRFELAEAFAPLPAYLTTGILPVHLLRGVTAAALADSAFNQRPVGAGPYRLAELTPGYVVLEANLAYHAGSPFIPRIELRFFEDSHALHAALGQDQLDGAYFTSGLSEAELLSVEKMSGMTTRRLNTGEITFLYLNLDRPQFQDRRVRQALLYALDRDAVAELVYGEMALRADSPLPEGIWAEANALERYGTDPRAAALLLDEAGWRTNSGGPRTRNGVPLNIVLTTNPDPESLAIADAIAEQWQQIGIGASVEVKGSTQLVRDTLGPRNFDALLYEQPAAPDPDPYAYWHSSQAIAEGFNLASMEHPRMDELLKTARATSKPLAREELYAQFQELFAQEVPSLPLYASSVYYVQRDTVKDALPGLVSRPGDRFWQVYRWYVRTK